MLGSFIPSLFVNRAAILGFLRMALIVLTVAAVIIVCVKGYNAIYSRGFVEGTAIKQAEIDRQRVANEKAIGLASKHADALTAQLRQKEIIFNNQIQELLYEADQDPAATSCGISSSSVRRINSVR